MPGETVKYTVTVTNNGTNTIHNVVVYDEMGTEGGVIDTIESLAPGESKTYELEITVSAAAKQNDVIEGSATANSNETGEVQGEAGVVVTVGQTTVPELLTTDHVWYLRGYPDNSIRPEGNITRAEVTMAFYRLLNDRKDIEDFDKSDYSDVDMNEWYAVSVMTLSELGIVTVSYTHLDVYKRQRLYHTLQ